MAVALVLVQVARLLQWLDWIVLSNDSLNESREKYVQNLNFSSFDEKKQSE